MKILIVDDENRARSLLRGIINEMGGEHDHVVLEAGTLSEAVETIKKEKAELVFMDIEMPGERGTELMNHLRPEDVNFKLVFTTAYEEFALKAFEMNALDYLLKPLRPSKVEATIKVVMEEKLKQNIHEQLSLLKSSIMTRNFQKIGLPLSDGVEFVLIDHVIQMEAEGMYTRIILNDEKDRLVSKPLRHFSELLNEDQNFIRPHRSHLVNLRYIKKYVNQDGGYLVLDNDKIVPLARNRKQKILEHIAG